MIMEVGEMKLILSRKGMDSAAGKMPSPILPDGTLLSLPIPDNNSGLSYRNIAYGGKSYMEIIQELKPNFDFSECKCCHLDPDIRDDITHPENWKPAFGQHGIPAVHLDKFGVGKDDLFLFFGWFRQSEYDKDGKLRFVRGAKDLHIIYGYMQVGDIIRSTDIKNNYGWHPHAKITDDSNRLYIPRDELSFAKGISGYGVLNYDKRNVLTKDGFSRSKWEIPQCFYSDDVTISWSGDCFKTAPNGDKYFQSPGRGQEMVINITDGIMDWIKTIIL